MMKPVSFYSWTRVYLIHNFLMKKHFIFELPATEREAWALQGPENKTLLIEVKQTNNASELFDNRFYLIQNPGSCFMYIM